MVQVYANILGANTADSDPGVHLFFENKRYIFSAGEGSLRFCNEHKVRFGKIENFFFSQLSHKTLGGLPGLIMTITDHGKNSISLHGPKNLLNYVQSLRFCLMRSDLKLEINEIDRPGLVFEDENLKVKAVPIAVKHVIQKKMDSKQVVHKFTLNGISKEYIEEKIEIPDEQPIKKVKHDQNAQYSIVPPPTPVDIAVSYICHTPDSRGKFDPSKAKQLGLKPGPLFQKLQNGEKVTLEDGRVIESSQVLGPSSRGTILIIVACPSREYMKELLESEEWTEYYSMNVGFVVHQTPSNVFEDVEYQNWIFKFGNKTAHIISNSEYCSNRVSFQDSATLQCKLNLIDSEIFPLVDQSEIHKLHKTIRSSEPMMNMIMSPHTYIGFQKEQILPFLDFPKIQMEFLEQTPEFIDNLKRYNQIKHMEFDVNNPHEKILSLLKRGMCELVFLGTGCAMPSKYRNVTAILLNLFDIGAILLDCGEGTVGQIYRLYGKEAPKVIMNVKLIWISHLHADHHLGLAKFLTHRQNLLTLTKAKSTITIVSHERMKTYLDEYEMIMRVKEAFDYEFVTNQDLLDPNSDKIKGVCKDLGLDQCFNVPVIHCKDAFGVVLTHKYGWKLVFSGDTRPCDELIQVGKDALILIHDATFDNELVVDAVEKCHSTTGEAIEVGHSMGAYRILLNHFSQRYPKIPILNSSYSGHTCITFDLMKIDFVDLKRLPLMLPVMESIFPPEKPEKAEKEIL